MRLAPLMTAACFSLALAAGAFESDAHTTVRNKSKPPALGAVVEVVLADVPLLTQRGETATFRDEVVADKIVVVSFFYSSCATICPVQSQIMQELQEALGDRLGGEVRLVSISVDPDNDGLAQLQEQAERYGAKPGWYWLSGRREYVKLVLTGLRATAKSPAEHEGVFLIGTSRDRRWRRIGDFPEPKALLQEINDVARKQPDSAAQDRK